MKQTKRRIVINIGLIILLLFGIRLFWDNNGLETTYLTVTDEEIPASFDQTTILHVSDLHNKNYGNRLLEEVNRIHPDYIFMTGDMVSANDTDFTVFYQFASEVAKTYECYYVLGNHELDLTNEQRKAMYETLTNFGVTVLDNEMVTLTKGEDEIHIYGMWYNAKFYRRETFVEEQMKKLLGEAKEGYNLLLTHNPDDFEVYADWGADLTFSGHVHGGMIRLPFVGGLISPTRTLFPPYDAGMYTYQDSHLIVSRGLSRGTIGFRLFNPPELVVVTLLREGREM